MDDASGLRRFWANPVVRGMLLFSAFRAVYGMGILVVTDVERTDVEFVCRTLGHTPVDSLQYVGVFFHPGSSADRTSSFSRRPTGPSTTPSASSDRW